MNVEPNSTIMFYGDLGLIPNSEDTRYFASESDKSTWFNSLTPKVILQNQTYSRRGRGVVRVKVNSGTMQELYNAQYMRFRNINFENKWFYAFVTNIEYVNNEVADVYYQDDVMMTWMGDFILGNCLVERECTATDNLYEHLIEENLPTGDYVVRKTEFVEINSDPVLVLSVARNSEDVGAAGLYRGNIVSGATYEKFDISESGKSALEGRIDELLGKPNGADAIISANIVFRKMMPVATETALQPLSPVNWAGGWHSWEHTIGNTIGNADGYRPKNKKLYNYPYCVMDVTNQEGSEKEFRYEFFSDHVPHFYWFGVAADVPEACIIPTQYKGSGINYIEDEMMVMKQFPQASLAIDQYKAYVAQMNSGGGYTRVSGKIAAKTLDMGTSIVSNFLGANASMSTAKNSTQAFNSMIGGVGNAANDASSYMGSMLELATNLLADKQYYSSIPDSVLGTPNSDLMMGINDKFFKVFHKSITKDYAETIDNYFTMFGYRVNKVKTPSMNNRTRFTYVKTLGCNVHGNMPSADARKIEEMFDKGMRFWKTGTTIGNYTQDNNVLS